MAENKDGKEEQRCRTIMADEQEANDNQGKGEESVSDKVNPKSDVTPRIEEKQKDDYIKKAIRGPSEER